MTWALALYLAIGLSFFFGLNLGRDAHEHRAVVYWRCSNRSEVVPLWWSLMGVACALWPFTLAVAWGRGR